MRTFKPEFAATLMLEAIYTTDEKACAKYNVTTRTLQKYRRRLFMDSELAKLLAEKQKTFDAAWAEELPSALREAITTIRESAKAIREEKDIRMSPDVMIALSKAVRVLGEVEFTRKVIGARLLNHADLLRAALPDLPDQTQELDYNN